MTMQQTDARDLPGGTNQSGLRDRNARVVLSYIRRHGALPSAEIARRSGLSAQTVSNIIRALEADKLLHRGAAIKGRVGKPSVPVSLDPKGVFSLGLNIGRRSAEMVLVDFLGRQIDAEIRAYPYPIITDVLGFLAETAPLLLRRNRVSRARVAGIGVARPNKIWNWLEFVNAPEGAMQEWQSLDLEETIPQLTGFDLVVENDATSACIAEHLIGRGHEFHDFAYVFLGTFVGGGLVLDGKVISGKTHNAAALGPLPVPDGAGGTVQLLDVASLHVLESALTAAGRDGRHLREAADSWDAMEPELTRWLETTAQHLAVACAAITSVVEVEAILIEGAFPEDIRARLTARIEAAFSRLDITGIEKPRIEAASAGRRARSVGAALLPIHAKYFLT